MFDWAFYKTPAFIQKLFSSIEWKKETNNKEIYLTFDDGPIPEVTPQVLNILEEFDAKATFFCVGDNIRKYPHILQRMIHQGHSIGNHTFNHLKAFKNSQATYLDNVDLCQNQIEKFSQSTDLLFRPPYGQLSLRLLRKLKSKGYRIIMWDVLSRDYNLNLSSEIILQKCIRYSEAGSIIVFHDNIKSKDKILQFLPLYLKHFSDIGYKFKKL